MRREIENIVAAFAEDVCFLFDWAAAQSQLVIVGLLGLLLTAEVLLVLLLLALLTY